jgi:hypothetical protein
MVDNTPPLLNDVYSTKRDEAANLMYTMLSSGPLTKEKVALALDAATSQVLRPAFNKVMDPYSNPPVANT